MSIHPICEICEEAPTDRIVRFSDLGTNFGLCSACYETRPEDVLVVPVELLPAPARLLLPAGDLRPDHGAERNRRMESKVETQEFETADNGERFAVSFVGSQSTVSERFCSTCDDWREVRGVLGPLLGCPTCGRGWR